MLELIKGFHIEPTNICTLKCPRCARTDFINTFPKKWKNKNLNLENFKNFLDIDIKEKTFYLCGNYGDPIYYDKIFELVEFLKKNSAQIVLTTNGSYKDKDWWVKLCSFMDMNDTIIFSIDGTETSFINYRINADWKSIKTGIDVAVQKTNTIWKFIPFAFNEQEITEVENTAKSFGMNFVIEKSSRWLSSDDALKPTKLFGDKTEHVIHWNYNNTTAIDPRCKKTHNEHYISADGYYTPCCYAADHRFFYSSQFFKDKSKYNIKETTISKVLDDLTDFYQNINQSNLKYCTFNCPKL
jgi:organic radical activating enzyme